MNLLGGVLCGILGESCESDVFRYFLNEQWHLSSLLITHCNINFSSFIFSLIPLQVSFYRNQPPQPMNELCLFIVAFHNRSRDLVLPFFFSFFVLQFWTVCEHTWKPSLHVSVQSLTSNLALTHTCLGADAPWPPLEGPPPSWVRSELFLAWHGPPDSPANLL